MAPLNPKTSLAIVSTTALAGMAQGAILYSGSVSTQLGVNDSYALDLNQDGTTDYTVRFDGYGSSMNQLKPFVDCRTSANPNAWVLAKTNTGAPLTLAGTMIDSTYAASFPTNKTGYLYEQYDNATVVGDWPSNADTEGYVGLTLANGSTTNFGWVHLIYNASSDTNKTLTVVDYAYESAAGRGIAAGDGPTPQPPAILTNPAAQVVPWGSPAQLQVQAAGTPAPGYQWRAGPVGSGGFTNLVDDANTAGSTTSTLSLASASGANALDYVVVVSNSSGAVTSSPPATLTVLQPLLSDSATPVLTNGGFELGLTGWATQLANGGAASFANSTSLIHNGTNALKISVSASGTTATAVRLLSTPFVASSTNTYILRFWASSSVNFAKLGINLVGASPAFPQIPFQISTNNNGYQEYFYAFRAAGNVSVAFNFQQAADYWLDDVEILDLIHTDGWDIPRMYLWQWGQLNYSKTNSVGWGGGDNAKSALLPDGSVAWVFNDTWTATLNFYSNIHGGGSMPRNSVVHQVGTNLYMQKTSTFFVPTNSANLFWIGDALVETNKLLVLLSEINATSITRVGTAIGRLSLPALTLDSITTVPSPGGDDYNQVVNGNDGFYYIYWTTNSPGNKVRVARTPVGSLAVSSAWTYWNGSTWVGDHTQAVGLPGLDAPWSFTQLGPSNYAAVYMPVLSLTIMGQFAPTPMGPWSLPVPLYDTAGEWGELNYMPNICAGTGSNGVYTINYSDNGSPDNLAKVAADKSYYNPHYVKANLWQMSPYSLAGGSGGPGSRLSIKFAADHNWGHDAIDNRWGAGVLGSTNWFNIYGSSSANSGVTNAPFYTANGNKYASGTTLVFSYANEMNAINNNAPLTNNVALVDSFINVNNNCWYLSVTNLDAPFTNGYSVYFYYRGNGVGRGGQNYLRYYSGPTTNSSVLGLKQWNLYTTSTTGDGRFTQDLTPLNTGTGGETYGANYCVFSNLSGGAFDLLITNGNYGGVSAIEIVANLAQTACTLASSTTNASFGTAVSFTATVVPAPPNGENVTFMDGASVLGLGAMGSGTATYASTGLAAGTHAIKAVYGGDASSLSSTSAVINLSITPTLSAPVVLPASTAYVGENVLMVCSNYVGGAPYAFQWRSSPDGVGFANVSGATTNALTLAQVVMSNSGYYELVLSANGQSATSSVVQLTVNPLPILQAQFNTGNLVLSWPQGVLLQATNVLGPWTTNSTVSPATNSPSAPQMFYRVQVR